MNQNSRNNCETIFPPFADMELPLLHLVLHEPDVALTDLALSVETGIFAFFFARIVTENHLRISTSILFCFLSASSLLGAMYHGFFPLRTETQIGWIIWIATMLSIGGAATMVWILIGVLMHKSLRWIVPGSLFLLEGYLLFLLFIDFHFWVSVAFSIPPLLALLFVFLSVGFRERSTAAVFGVISILLMFVASALQQKHVGIHPIYFNFNALYHLIQGIALALLFYSLRFLQEKGKSNFQTR